MILGGSRTHVKVGRVSHAIQCLEGSHDCEFFDLITLNISLYHVVTVACIPSIV